MITEQPNPQELTLMIMTEQPKAQELRLMIITEQPKAPELEAHDHHKAAKSSRTGHWMQAHARRYIQFGSQLRKDKKD